MLKNSGKYLITILITAIFIFGTSIHAETSNESDEIRFIRIAANKGDAEAQYYLALAYDTGDGVEKDQKKAIEWYQKSAAQDYVDSMFNLAVSYNDGEGVEQNKELALLWYTKAAEKGDSDAQNNLAFMYEQGDGVEANLALALEWYRKSALQGNALAQFHLADMYANGKGLVEAYKVEAYAWYRVASANKEQRAAQQADAIFQQLNDDEQKQAEALAQKYIADYRKQK
jgi:uncharacterized protein